MHSFIEIKRSARFFAQWKVSFDVCFMLIKDEGKQRQSLLPIEMPYHDLITVKTQLHQGHEHNPPTIVSSRTFPLNSTFINTSV